MTFFLYGIDKWKAKRTKWRVLEATLLTSGSISTGCRVCFGAAGQHYQRKGCKDD
ncbi:MAG: DUF1294 domain-containing protein [Paludibacteraceae bacterium]|nr:DUF1294 domain-containing protein [Paludibacteraceae bacterium]